MAEKVLRDIARRNGHLIRKRRSPTLKAHYGDGYAIIDRERNWLLSGAKTSDGCDLSLDGLAQWYQDDKDNTGWQRIVIESILADKVKSEAKTVGQ